MIARIERTPNDSLFLPLLVDGHREASRAWVGKPGERRTNRESKRDAASRTLQFDAIRNNRLLGRVNCTKREREREREKVLEAPRRALWDGEPPKSLATRTNGRQNVAHFPLRLCAAYARVRLYNR